jgi:hypothetical protein
MCPTYLLNAKNTKKRTRKSSTYSIAQPAHVGNLIQATAIETLCGEPSMAEWEVGRLVGCRGREEWVTG